MDSIISQNLHSSMATQKICLFIGKTRSLDIIGKIMPLLKSTVSSFKRTIQLVQLLLSELFKKFSSL